MFQQTNFGAVTVVAMNEPLTLTTTEELGEFMENASSQGQPLSVFDMSHVPLMDSNGLETLLNLKDHFEHRGGRLKIAAPVPLCREILRITGVEKHFEIFDGVSDAVRSFVR